MYMYLQVSEKGQCRAFDPRQLNATGECRSGKRKSWATSGKGERWGWAEEQKAPVDEEVVWDARPEALSSAFSMLTGC